MPKLTSEELGNHARLDPRHNQWGIYSSDHWPFGASVFFWFKTEDELRARIADGSFDVDGDEKDWQPVLAGMTSAIAQIKELSPQDVDAINEQSNGAFDIRWLGRFEDLLSGKDPFALELREVWRQDDETSEDELVKPVGTGEVDQFVEFIQQYGA